MVSPDSQAQRARCQAETPLIDLFKFASPALSHRVKRAQLLRLGVGLSDDDLVIAQADGSIVQPIYISQHWARTIRTTKLAHLRFHDLRHAHATHLLANGVHPKVASERLGHSKVGSP